MTDVITALTKATDMAIYLLSERVRADEAFVKAKLAVQQQQQQISDLERRIEALESSGNDRT